MRWHQVSVEAEADPVSDDDLEAFAETLEYLGAAGTAVGGAVRSVSATFALDVDDVVLAAETGRDLFFRASEKAGIPVRDVMRLEVLADQQVERELTREPESYLGVTEIADLLGVSRQRVSELRGREGFPEPIAELAAGPVWALTHLRRFLDEWPRRPGRAPKWQDELDQMRELTQARRREVFALVDRLTANERDVLLEVLNRGTSFHDIAEERGVSVDAARATFRRALAKVRSAMAHEIGTFGEDPTDPEKPAESS